MECNNKLNKTMTRLKGIKKKGEAKKTRFCKINEEG